MSVLSIVVLNLGAPFLIGLVVFYLSSGFFVVFFTASFMELSRHMRLPSLWAGMGRAMNNVSAALITNGSVALLATGNSLAAIVIALVLFVAVSVAMAVYTARMNAVMEPKEPPASQKSDEERREAFIAKYGLTEREWDVFSQMISSDSSAPGDRRLPVPVQADGGTAYLRPVRKDGRKIPHHYVPALP